MIKGKQWGRERAFHRLWRLLGKLILLRAGHVSDESGCVIIQTDTICLVAALGLPRFIGVPLSFALNWFLGVLVAQWLLGYKSSYPEYFNEKEE